MPCTHVRHRRSDETVGSATANVPALHVDTGRHWTGLGSGDHVDPKAQRTVLASVDAAHCLSVVAEGG